MIKLLLTAAATLGYGFIVSYDGEVDYEGGDVVDALDALEACDEINLNIIDENDKRIGWAYIINDLDDDEKIADCSGWVDRWMEDNG